MKNNTIKLIGFLLSLIFIFSAVACNPGEDPSVDPPKDELKEWEYVVPETDDEDFIYNGTHNLNAVDIDDEYLVVDGKVAFYLICSNFTAKTEFKDLFKQATGLDTSSTYSSSRPIYISIGDTEQLSKSGIDTKEYSLSTYGYRIVSDSEHNIYIFSESDRGAVYGVYGFMKIMFNYECYLYDCIKIDNKVSDNVCEDIPLKEFNAIDIPDIPYVSGDDYQVNTTTNNFNYRVLSDGQRWDRFMTPRARTTLTDDFSGTAARSTNTLSILNPDLYTNHPKWFGPRSYERTDRRMQQWCYTAHGDADEYQAMQDELFEMCKASIIRNGDPLNKNFLCIMNEDNSNHCKCDACLAGMEKYGTYSGIVCVFMNQLAERVQDWFDNDEEGQEQYERYNGNFRLMFDAYSFTREAPVTIDKDGKITPNKEEVVLNKLITVYLASGFASSGFTNEEKASVVTNRDLISSWDFLLQTESSIYVWTYATRLYRMGGKIAPIFNKELNEYFFRYLAKHGIGSLFMQTCATEYGGTAWIDLKIFIYNQLCWNCNQTKEDLIDRYITGVYGCTDVAQTMKDLYTNMFQNYFYTNEYKIGWSTVDNKTVSYPQETLDVWNNYIAQAKQQLLAHKENEDISESQYTLIFKEIEKEQLGIVFAEYCVGGQQSATLKATMMNILAGSNKSMKNYLTYKEADQASLYQCLDNNIKFDHSSAAVIL